MPQLPKLDSELKQSIQVNAESGSYLFECDVQNITTAGTRVNLPFLECRSITLIAKRSNTGSIYIGGSNVSSTNYGIELKAGETFDINIANTNLVWLDASVSGEGISYVAI